MASPRRLMPRGELKTEARKERMTPDQVLELVNVVKWPITLVVIAFIIRRRMQRR